MACIVTGYHGTTLKSAEAIRATPINFRLSTSVGHWLGTGIYFFEGSEAKGYEWAHRQVARIETGTDAPPAFQRAVIGARR